MSTSFIFPDTSKLVLSAGEVLYGDVDDWMSSMAKDLKVRSSTITDWANARRTPPRPVLKQLEELVRYKASTAGKIADVLCDGARRMVCPVPGCGANLSVVHAPSGRIITCISGHHSFRPKDGPPFGPNVEKEFVEIDQKDAQEARSILWLADISEDDFPEFSRRVRGIFGPYEAYLEHLDRRRARWEATPGNVVIQVPVTAADLAIFVRQRGGCSAQDLTALASLKHLGRL